MAYIAYCLHIIALIIYQNT